MGKRFSKIEGLIKRAQQFDVDITADNNIKAYLDFREGISTDYKTTGVARGSSKPATLLPFYTRRFTVDFRHAIKVSGRAAIQLSSLGASAELGIDLGSDDGTTPSARGKIVKGYSPAKVIITKVLETAVTKKSGILLLDYKKTSGESYTLPFGAINTAGKKTYTDQQGNLTKEFAKGAVRVSFKQERPGFA